MRDLEIRGSGNLLGAAQSGFIGAVGFETYVQLLADAVGERKGAQRAREDAREAVIDVKLDAYIPDDDIPEVSQKIAIYQQLAAARTIADVEEAVASVRDRFGVPAAAVRRPRERSRGCAVMALPGRRPPGTVINEQRLTLGVGSGFRLDLATIPKPPVADQVLSPVR